MEENDVEEPAAAEEESSNEDEASQAEQTDQSVETPDTNEVPQAENADADDEPEEPEGEEAIDEPEDLDPADEAADDGEGAAHEEAAEEGEPLVGDEPVDEPEGMDPAAAAQATAVMEPVADADTDDAASIIDMPKKKHRARKVILILLAAVIVILAAAAGALAYDDSQRTSKVPTPTMLDGEINVSGMTAEELAKTVQTRVDNGFTTKAKVDVDGESYTIKLSDVGKLDVQATVDDAFAPYDTSIFERCADRVLTLVGAKTNDYRVSTQIDLSDKKLTKKVKKIAEESNADAVDAGYTFEDGKVKTTKAKSGIKVDVESTVAAIKEALEAGTGNATTAVEATLKKVEAENSKPGKAIYVDTNACVLYLYDNGKVTFKCDCSPGRSGYATPTGNFTLESKIKNPTWSNPHSSWSANMPETIGPGPSNPMGLRKMGISCGGGIFIHGTTNIGALGSRDSHGCIRLANANVVKLFDMVSVGIPVFIR